MLKDRKFWTGIFLGGLIGTSTMLLQPMRAADDGGALSKIAGAMATIIKQQQLTNKELMTIRSNSQTMNESLNQLKQLQGLAGSGEGR